MSSHRRLQDAAVVLQTALVVQQLHRFPRIRLLHYIVQDIIQVSIPKINLFNQVSCLFSVLLP
jgi:hypothetical protein